MSDERSAIDWAREAEFSGPVRWADVEAEIMSRPPPAVEKELGGSLTASRTVGPFAMAIFAVIGAPLFGSVLIGLGLLLAHMNGPTESDEVLRGARLALLTAGIVLVLTVLSWSEGGRRGSRWRVALAGGIAVASAVAQLVVRTGDDAYKDDSLSTITLVVSAGGLVVLLVLVLGSRSWPRRTPRRDRPDRTPEGLGYMGARAKVIEILVKRNVVDKDAVDVQEMINMPLGSWHELDDAPR